MRWAQADTAEALIYALRASNLPYLIELVELQAINHLLEPGDLLIAHDLIDLAGPVQRTFFRHKGYGFLPHNPPFCPVLRHYCSAAALSVLATMACDVRPRLFRRGTYAAVPADVALSEEHRQVLIDWGADVVGTGVIPTSGLARELELCYAPLGWVQQAGDESSGALGEATTNVLRAVIQATALALPVERGCACASAMQGVVERGLVEPDWQTWLPPAT
ncbi:MAG: MTAP family purine nucleoside phosphorylase [Chloroflexaceae bacterium]|nr:MTAP family purine nucleoside phosphorylase [Chloroflexaceae bacterium]